MQTEKAIRRTHEISGSIKITIPSDFAEALNISVGDYIRWRLADHLGSKALIILPEDISPSKESLIDT
jgi:hypothetical protein